MWAFASGLTSALNGYSQWVFPGVESFAATNAFFSEYGDLITQVDGRTSVPRHRPPHCAPIYSPTALRPPPIGPCPIGPCLR